MVWIDHIRTNSISVLAYHAGGCMGCAHQFFTALSYHTKVKGITMTGNPKHADVLIVTGCINDKSREIIKQLYGQMPSPKAVIAAGACTCEGSLFRTEENKLHSLEEVIPVDAWVRGCTPGLNEMLDAVVRAVECSLEKDESGRQHD